MNEIKTCTKCGECKPATAEHFMKDASLKSGLRASCRECCNKAAREYRKTNRETLRRKQIEYANQNREKLNARDRRKYWTDPEAARERARVYREENHERIKQLRKAWPSAAPDRAKAYDKNSKGRRRARIASSESDVDSAFLIEIQRAGTDCSLCRVQMTNASPHLPTHRNIDHIWPLNCGGSHTRGNLRVICRQCNGTRPHNGGGLRKIESEMILRHGCVAYVPMVAEAKA